MGIGFKNLNFGSTMVLSNDKLASLAIEVMAPYTMIITPTIVSIIISNRIDEVLANEWNSYAEYPEWNNSNIPIMYAPNAVEDVMANYGNRK
jgi:hypothetical protein